MQTISINFIVPQGWHELSGKPLRYVYQLIAGDFASDEMKTLCLLQWSGTKVIGRQDSSPSEATPSATGSYLVKLGKQMFELTPLTLAELLVNLDWLGTTPTSPVHPSKMNRRQALAADFQGVPFETFIVCDNYFQGYLQTQQDYLLDEISFLAVWVKFLHTSVLDFRCRQRVYDTFISPSNNEAVNLTLYAVDVGVENLLVRVVNDFLFGTIPLVIRNEFCVQ